MDDAGAVRRTARRFTRDARRLGKTGQTWVADCIGPNGQPMRIELRPATGAKEGWIFLTAKAMHGSTPCTDEAMRAFIAERGLDVHEDEDPFGGLRYHVRAR